MRKKGFTLAEVLTCLVVIGIIAAILMSNLKMQSYNQKAFVSNARKIIDNFENASLSILEEKKDFPLGTFVYQKTRESFVYGGMPSVESSANVVSLYGKYIKYETSGINFCDYSAACSDSNVKGARIPGGAYIGLLVNKNLIACPNYKIPDPTAAKGSDIPTTTGTGQCWAKLYIDVNGKEGPNTEGEDYYVFGMDASGVAI